ncbi:MAG: threonylcarbamoyl-AMP synthase [Desulfobacterales bacterium]|uniref:L-threonylcarbamoyladenylate synthase n=1 Tax=Candidatus Desulfaltia bathyphila TaxID=2841697 RepID=A0A8J6N521_9BACT|nr:threonylcarbamoyl-AMP synthase [Candidatus Desulfaltia bathyphila]MBL7196351.1 threonylcarbamoyl-AMP synthase [Desulfobacterales bacterium]MBL7207081.1 threonylcarbamoyl-AMP synthase [Desulfobacterales bacterium]
MFDKIRKIDPVNPQHDLIVETARVIEKGGVVMFPTSFIYGLGADAFNVDAIDRVFRIKKRPHNKPLSVLAKNREALYSLVQYIPPYASIIMDRFWPGKITIVFKAKDGLSESLTASTGTIGVRIPEHPAACALVDALDNPITGTSANFSGHAGCSQISDIDPMIADELDLILDAGELEGGIGSTVIDVTGDAPAILREGAVPAKDIFALFK